MVKFYNYVNVLKEYFPLEGKRILIWGKSISALNLYIDLQTNSKIDIVGFTDSFVEDTGEEFAGLPVFTFKEIQQLGELIIYIATYNPKYQREILDYVQPLKNVSVLCRGVVYGAGQYDVLKMDKKINKNSEKIQAVKNALCDKKSINTFEKLLKYRISNNQSLLEEVCENSHKQYFPNNGDILTKQRDEVFIDAGAYNGETSNSFSEWVGGQYEKIYIMEPDKTMFHVAKEYVKIQGLHDVNLINRAAYSGTGEISFHNSIETGSSKIEKNGESIVETITIDQMLEGKKATFIKMDIEGTEMEALEGAKDTIVRFRPKLAISIYHKDDDLWEIPYYIMKHYPWYKLFIRHYTPLTIETVLYASL